MGMFRSSVIVPAGTYGRDRAATSALVHRVSRTQAAARGKKIISSPVRQVWVPLDGNRRPCDEDSPERRYYWYRGVYVATIAVHRRPPPQSPDESGWT
jgi:hypothetical protein